MKYVRWIAIALVALVLIVFAIANRDQVELTLWPLPFTVTAPAYLIVLVTLLIGFLAGEFAAWVNGHRWRREARRLRRRIEELEQRLATSERTNALAQPAGMATAPNPARAIAPSRAN
jgi:uncharacterized integral membrane protein